MKILNLYAGIGGNRQDWKGVSVTAIELDPVLAAIYAARFPEDNVIVADAHQFLLEHYKDFDFIWSSPPCQSHSSSAEHLREVPGHFCCISRHEALSGDTVSSS